MMGPLRITLGALAAALCVAHPATAEDPPANLFNGVVGNGQLIPQTAPGERWGVIGRELMVIEVLAETGVCRLTMRGDGSPCPMIRLPDGTERAEQIVGFHRAGPLTIEVDRLIYFPRYMSLVHGVPPRFEYVGEAEYRN